ncbi:endonuclease V [Martensiomyces pterosporus]|nr:endonuclease V [Martensiomyces pterosporus]
MADMPAATVGPETISEWESRQEELRARLETHDRLDFEWRERGAAKGFVGLARVGGIDISYPRGCTGRAVAALAILEYPSMKILYEISELVPIAAPYVAGYLAFREMEAYQAVFGRLMAEKPELLPQVVLVDGNGTLHPRRFGSACHVGVELGIPTVGVAKNFIHIDDLHTDARALKERFKADSQLAEVELSGDAGIYGMAIAPKGHATNPIFVSSGHRVSLGTAVKLVRACSLHRVPEPIRIADLSSRVISRRMEAEL